MNYPELVSAVLEENRKVLEAVSTKSVDRLIEEILKAKSVHLYAMGRMQLSVRAFAMRLTHMGIPSTLSLTRPVDGSGQAICSSGIVRSLTLN
jgi:6-phospho-3-hexuloisomerase